ncbi:MAG: tripartite tricarboxylate transporter TctB family protein [Proteobacteria bacterium]|nr:tripartite tricarboxylate transporter TctB family protein [Pseudomonadota bacterium]
MSTPPPISDIGQPPPPHGHDAPQSPRADFIAAVLWIVFGAAVAVASWRMDRLENQDINPYTVPGLLPGLLGVAVVFFGVLMLVRAWRAGGLANEGPAGGARGMSAGELKRFGLIVGLCLLFGVVLIGHGLPFWAAAAIYVTATIATLQYPQRKADGQRLRGLALALVIGLCAGILITLVFQEIFLVRLP